MREDPEAVCERILIGRSPAMRSLRAEILVLARARLRSVLVLGETGAGKDLVPRALHACGEGRGPRNGIHRPYRTFWRALPRTG